MKYVPKNYRCMVCRGEHYNKYEECEHCGAVGSYEPIKSMETLPVIERPKHYKRNGIDVIGFAELQFPKEERKGFYRINILKYITRYDRKNGLEDLEKAADYLNMLIKLERGGEE